MSLLVLVDNTRTDKNTAHCYLDLYEQLLSPKKFTAKNVLEIGVAHGGGSIKLWNDYFPNATVHGVDVIGIDEIATDLKQSPRIKLFPSTNAYSDEFVASLPSHFDMVLDDGPHTLESMKYFVSKYSSLLNETGVLILEDIQSWEWIQPLVAHVPESLHGYLEIYDLRPKHGRYDDIVLVINKQRPSSPYIQQYIARKVFSCAP